MNERLKEAIGYAMYKNQLSKKELAEYMNMSYPTMLSKLNDPGTFKISEAENLCNYLNIDLNEFINPLND